MNPSLTTFFSDPDPQVDDFLLEHTARASRGVQRIGTSIFWVALLVIVVARAAFFQPDLFASFRDQPPIPGYVSIR